MSNLEDKNEYWSVTFSDQDFSNSLFSNTNQISADFAEATNYAIDVYRNEIKHANLAVLKRLDC